MRRVPSIHFILSVVLVGGAGCGRSRALSVHDGAVVGAGEGPTAVADSRDGGSDALAVAALDANATDATTTDARATDALATAPDAAADAPPSLPPNRYRAIAVATGEYHSCALLDDHRVKCWGDNNIGQLGLGDTKNRGDDSSTMGDNLPTVDLGTGRTATAIAASRYASCAILDDQTVKCWGNNIGDKPGQMGDRLPALDFGARKAVNLAMGEYFDCASMDDDTIWCWGSEDTVTPQLQSGLPMKAVRALGPGDDGVVAIYEDGTLSPVLCCGSPAVVSPLPVIPSGRKVVAVAGGSIDSGGDSACVLLDDATTVCLDGALESRTRPANAIAIGVMRIDGLCSAFSDGSVRCQLHCTSPYPCSNDGSYLLGSPALTVTSNGNDFACALLADGDVKCWDAYAPTGDRLADHLGADFDLTHTDAGITYGAWHPVDLGTHP